MAPIDARDSAPHQRETDGERCYALSQYGEECIGEPHRMIAMVLPNEMIVLREEKRKSEIAWSMTVTAVVQPSQLYHHVGARYMTNSADGMVVS